jgi:protein-S-isoprenylcysteine O-methyltransferase Ste14
MSIERLIREIGGLVAWVMLAVLMFGVWQGTRRAAGRTSGRAATWLRSPIFYVLALAAFLAFSLWGWRPLPFNLPPAYQPSTLLAGCLLYFPGMGLILWGRIALGRMYFVSTSMGAQLFAGHRLVTSGPFGLVRHPMYVGLLAAALGSLFIYQTLTTLVFTVFAPLVLLRARREEKVLAAAFGEQWLEYCRNVPPFWPSIERLRHLMASNKAAGRRS